VRELPQRAGINPAPPRDAGPDRAEFLHRQTEAILAADLVVVDLLDGTKAYALAMIEHADRRAHIPGATAHPPTDQAVQQAHNPVMDLKDTAASTKFPIHDRNAPFNVALDQVLADAEIEVNRSATRTPRTNSTMER
jgi:transposase InsO family protein